MATLQTNLLPSNPFTKPSTSHTHTISPPQKFKFQAPTATFHGSKDKTLSTHKNPQTHFPSITKNTNYTSLGPEGNTQIDHCLSLLRGNSISDCRQIHAQAVKFNAFKANGFIGNKLAMMYARNTEFLDNARKLFDEIPERTVPAYAALIGSYCRLGKWDDLFLVFGLMVDEGLLPDMYLVPTLLKACGAVQMMGSGKMIHGYVIRNELDSDVFVGNSLIDLYAKCGDFRCSRSVFDSMRERNVVSWTALVSAYMEEGLLDEAMEVFLSMQLNGVTPDLISWNALVSGFAQNGEIDLALKFLEEMQERGMKPRVNTWNGIISGCVRSGYLEDALNAFNEMLRFPEDPNIVTIVSTLPACAGLRDSDLGRALHGYALKHGLCRNIHVEGSLIDMYSKCGRHDYAEKVFIKAEKKNTTMWNEMIAAACGNQGKLEEAIRLLGLMQNDGLKPDVITYNTMLAGYARNGKKAEAYEIAACGNEGKLEEAIRLLGLMQNDGLKPDVVTYNTMLAGYARNGQKAEAYELLFKMIQMQLRPNVISFNVLISGFQQSGLTQEALKLFRIMLSPSSGFLLNKVLDESIQQNPITITGALAACADLSIQPNPITITGALAACADLKLWHQGKEIHGYILRNDLEPNIYVSSALVDVYSKSHDMVSATKVFRRIEGKNTICWNVLIAGHISNREPAVALELLYEMLVEGVEPSSITFMMLLPACGDMAALQLGRQLHGYIIKSQIVESNVSMETLAIALSVMYLKCGKMREAKLVYDSEIKEGATLWNAMISEYSIHKKASTKNCA